MRQILLPIDPPDPTDRAQRAHRNGRWRESPLVPGFGLRPLGHVLADVLAWRCRTATADAGQGAFRGVPTFRSGVQVPAADLHAFAQGLLDDAELDQMLYACLALDWRSARHVWLAKDPVTPLPTLGLLQPLAQGLVPRQGGREPALRQTGQDSAPRQANGDMPRLALSPDWANRLIAGQVGAVHGEAAARLRQAGWHAVPVMPDSAAEGISIAAALVPRCSGAIALLRDHFAVAIAEHPSGQTEPSAADGPPESLSPETPDLAEELS